MNRPSAGHSDATVNNTLTIRVLPAGIECYFDGSHPVIIGRDAAAHVLVRDDATSPEHAVLKLESGRWVFEDRSGNGTYLDGSQIPSRLPLDRAVTLALGSAADGAQVRIIPPTRFGEPSPHVPEQPSFEPGRSAPGHYRGSFRAAGARIRIGRALDNEIVLDDPLVSARHAELRATSAGGLEILDLGSRDGTFVDGRPVDRRALLQEGSLVAVGHTLLRLRGGALEKYSDAGISFAALDLSVTAGKRTLLDDVSFPLSAGQLLAVLGPAGSGKYTLLKALIGSQPATRGTVLYNGRDLYGNYAELRNRIGYVPQDDPLHPKLTVHSVLDYAARLRLPADFSSAERTSRVDEVLEDLGLTQSANVRIERLSIGRRKRASIAIELLAKPSLLVLDEPTAGLDPGDQQSMMELLRKLADDGRTVVAVTHSIQDLDLCDRLLFLAPGGQLAYFGSPSQALEFFELPDYQSTLRQLEQDSQGTAKQRFASSAQAQEFVHGPLAAQRADQEILAAQADARARASAAGKKRRAREAEQPRRTVRPPRGTHQLLPLTRRYSALIIADKRSTLLNFAQAPVLGLLLLAIFGADTLKPGTSAAAANSPTILLVLTLAAGYLGLSSAIREIAKERPVLTRERANGLSARSYVLSKALLLAMITIIQCFVLTYIALLRQNNLNRGVALPNGELELALVLSLVGLTAMALGLLISALARHADKVLAAVPAVLFIQFALSGAVFPVAGTPGLDHLSYLSAARWGYSAAADTAHLTPQATAAWARDLGALAALAVLPIAGAGLLVRPARRPRRS